MVENLATQIIEAARQLPRRLLDLPYSDKNKLAQDPFPALQDWLGQLKRTAPIQRLVQEESPEPQDKAVLRKLERKEILEKIESRYRFQEPLVEKYVEQVLEEE